MKEKIILAISIAGLCAALACTIGVRKAPNQHPIEVTEQPSITATAATTTPSRTPETKPPTTYEQPKDEPQTTEQMQTTQPPVTTTEPKPAEPTEKIEPITPRNGDKKDGYIYLNGFGWIENQGGGGKAEYAEDMYENGNKIGYFG